MTAAIGVGVAVEVVLAAFHGQAGEEAVGEEAAAAVSTSVSSGRREGSCWGDDGSRLKAEAEGGCG